MDPPSPKYQEDPRRASERLPGMEWEQPSPLDSTPTRGFGDSGSSARFDKMAQPKQFDFGGSTEKRPGRQTQRLPLAGRSLQQKMHGPQAADLLKNDVWEKPKKQPTDLLQDIFAASANTSGPGYSFAGAPSTPGPRTFGNDAFSFDFGPQ